MGNRKSILYVAKETFQPEAEADGESPYLSIRVQPISTSVVKCHLNSTKIGKKSVAVC